MKAWRIILPAMLTLLSGVRAGAQHQCQTPSDNSSTPAIGPAKYPRSENVALTVPKGMAIQVIIDKELKVDKVGQPIRGRVVEPIYAFDKLVVPAGAEVTGEITQLEEVSGGKRTLEALNADLSPSRNSRTQQRSRFRAARRQYRASPCRHSRAAKSVHYVPHSHS